MTIRCIGNTGRFLRSLSKDNNSDNESDYKLDKYGSFARTEFNEYKLGQIYLVMGILFCENHQRYLIDDYGRVEAAPAELFEVISGRIVDPDWYYIKLARDDSFYPLIEAVISYKELCTDESAVKKLLMDDEDALTIYFKHKSDLERIIEEGVV